ncbi:MAG: glucose-6-phosphate dehydrogenase, partial [Halanaerobiales bacterium]
MERENNSVIEFIIFGGTGDLARRKLFPGFYNLYKKGVLSDNLKIRAIGRRYKREEKYCRQIKKSVKKHSRLEFTETDWRGFRKKINYLQFDIKSDTGYKKLKEDIDNTPVVFYLAVAPDFFDLIVNKLEQYGLNNGARLVIEKPFGYDLESARRLNNKINSVFSEEDIFRIDHYLGKEMLQNIMVIRFANSIFEPLWNNKYIDNIQIISTESSGVGDRTGYYERSGALKDMVQNHMMQLLSLTAMEPPVDMKTESIRDEKVKVLKTITLDTDKIKNNVIRGQYGPGRIDGNSVAG